MGGPGSGRKKGSGAKSSLEKNLRKKKNRSESEDIMLMMAKLHKMTNGNVRKPSNNMNIPGNITLIGRKRK